MEEPCVEEPFVKSHGANSAPPLARGRYATESFVSVLEPDEVNDDGCEVIIDRGDTLERLCMALLDERARRIAIGMPSRDAGGRPDELREKVLMRC